MDVMMNMTTEDVRVLRRHFRGRMNLEQFVSTLKQTLHDRIRSELDFVVGVVELFHTIDVNGDEQLDWDEFAGYMMDAGQAKADFYFDDLQQRAKRYRHLPLPLRDAKTPMNSVRSCVQQLLHLPEQRALAYFERDSDVVYLYALRFDRNEAPRHLSTMRLHTAFQEHTVLGIEYVPARSLLVVASMLHTGYLSTWSTADLHNPAMVHRVETGAPHEHLCWVPSLQCLLSAAVVFPAIAARPGKGDGYRPHSATLVTKLNQLTRWDIAGGSGAASGALVKTEFVLRDRLKGVSSLATYKCINRTHTAVGCEDGVVTVVDAESWETVSSFDAHSNGVKMLRFSPLTECLASIGVHSYSDETTLHVSIWKKRGVAGRLAFEAALKLHDAPLELIAFVDSRRHLLSLDAGGTFNVYSSVLLTPTSEPWECLQRFQVAPSPGPHRNRILSCFVVPESPASDAVLVTAGHRVTFYDVCEVKEREEVFFTSFCQALNLLVGVTATKLLFWKADTGGLWKTFEYAAILSASSDAALLSASNRPGGERGSARSITAACIDDRERKVILGDDAGSLRVINAVNGNVMKELDPHAQAVASVSYVLRGKCVVSVSVDSCLHIYDENNALGYYVPFGAAHPQSVLLHSLRFLPEVPSVPIPPLQRHRHERRTQQRHHRHRSRACRDDVEGIDSSLTMSYEPPPERFDILKSVGNLALDRVAVLTSGSRGESFVQVWSFDLSHTHGTCVAPLDDEITCVSFLGASADIVGGTASGRVLLWRASREDPGYQCSIELQCVADTEQHSNNDARVSAIHHVFAVHATVALEAAEMSSSVAADADDNDEATDTFPLTGDELGIVTKWVVRCSSECPEHSVSHSLVGTDPAVDLDRSVAPVARPTVASSSDSAGAVLQHEEMALGYEAVAGLYNRAFDQERRGAAALGESSDSHLSPSRRRKPRTRLARLLPTSRWDAHTSPILCLNYALDPLVVLTASTCGRVKVWSFGGELLGVLDDFASRRQPETQPWRVPLDMGERRRRKEQDAQQFLDKFKGTHRRGKQPRLSVLQERLALSHEELAFDYAAEKKTQQRRRHSRLPVRTSDVGRAIRKFVLAQASAPAAAANVASRRSSTTPTSSTLKVDDSSRSLQVVLKEIDQLQSQTSARTGSAGASSHRDGGIAALAPNASADSLPATRKKRYPRVTLADVKPLLAAFRPRSSSNAVHCELPQLHAQPSNDERRPPPASRKNEIVFTSASFVKRSTGVSSYALQVAEADARLTVLDLRDDAGASNQEPKTRPLAVATPAQGSSDPVLTHHVKLAHIWRHQP